MLGALAHAQANLHSTFAHYAMHTPRARPYLLIMHTHMYVRTHTRRVTLAPTLTHHAHVHAHHTQACTHAHVYTTPTPIFTHYAHVYVHHTHTHAHANTDHTHSYTPRARTCTRLHSTYHTHIYWHTCTQSHERAYILLIHTFYTHIDTLRMSTKGSKLPINTRRKMSEGMI